MDRIFTFLGLKSGFLVFHVFWVWHSFLLHIVVFKGFCWSSLRSIDVRIRAGVFCLFFAVFLLFSFCCRVACHILPVLGLSLRICLVGPLISFMYRFF